MGKLKLISIDGRTELFKLLLMITTQSLIYTVFFYSLSYFDDFSFIAVSLALFSVISMCFLLFYNKKSISYIELSADNFLMEWEKNKIKIRFSQIEKTYVRKKHTLVLVLNNGLELCIPCFAMGSLSQDRTGIWQLKKNDLKDLHWVEYASASEQIMQLKNVIDLKIEENKAIDRYIDKLQKVA